ncbi:MAG: phosphoenolpyruvate carboxykinase (ATP) [Christensenellales bacterium]|jgi:phosphoenolpyruvate carboxykinase (ATP)
MATRERFKWSEIKKNSPYFSSIKATIETAFMGNNVYPVQTLKEAYKLASESPGTIVTNVPVYEPEKIGLAKDSKVLLFNDGDVKGRAAAARRILGEPGVNEEEYAGKIREAVYQTRSRIMYHAQAYIGLDKDFMVKAHLLIPEGEENVMYSWLLNFQYITEQYYNMYKDSRVIENESDIYIFSDPSWSHPDHPLGLTFFDPQHNCAALLGMRYFGEHKKGTLTLAWGIANRHGYASCHGGQKRYNLKDGRKYVVGVFGLSGSGKSTITHAQHGGKYDITVLHDDAFIISTDDKSSIALEPAYFDKTQDYPTDDPNNKYLVTVQNNGATLDEDGNIVLVTEDIRNGNGRAMKSRLWSPNREDVFHEPVNAIIWLMKDPTLPPVVKISDATLASTLGATLATKRTSAERLAPGVDPDALVVEPYANPFRTYPLKNDYEKFKELFEKLGVNCYIFNTGFFLDKKVTVQATLGSLEAIIEDTAQFNDMGIKGMSYLPVEGFIPDFSDPKYKKQFVARIKDRIGFIEAKATEKGGFDELPAEALESMKKVAAQAEKL